MFFPDYDYDDEDSEAEELAAERRANRRYRLALEKHPDCSDPDHPGCDQCDEND